MSGPSIPPILQAEAYHGRGFVMIRNGKTENVIEQTKHHPDVVLPICEVPDFPAFLDATAGAIKDARVIVALGNSRTTNFGNWPSIVATTRLRDGQGIVLNLADWACSTENHVASNEYLLGCLHERGARDISVVLFGALLDLTRKLTYYTQYMDNLLPLPFTEHEEQLNAHRYGFELAGLHDQIPDAPDGVARWIARRILATVKN